MITSAKTLFRPCIDLHNGQVKQIVGGTLTENDQHVMTNFVSSKPSSYYAELYKKHCLIGGHLIKLGPGNDLAAVEALKSWPNGLQVGGGINIENAQKWLDLGASKVIVTSWLFTDKKFDLNKLKALSDKIGKDRLVVDISEFLVHAADVEGLCQGIDEDLVKCLGTWVNIPTTYAGGANSVEDLNKVNILSKGKVDLTIGRYVLQIYTSLI
ncbi:1-(5-phosphoribosyl)-5-[(5-phosphoribosylamino)methylideneamino] imidazole-4-carboxamide isomerase [Smittium culicis]|uniref:1-(5-phosphoribosyl)-5-[(5-phosphoribosylamino)methylideneamino] imidazole-4-carboxamide isomerase n=1 Tax=Smittium culicis TaxID=133412 RepID=A0A1R1XSX1_9FUNG|nr:1-(5-phosphoribosyl)-5-[(5-phosphoribosylamino)methylideneamino] imidazole-4-carboxamide isomerase [Smittium culicis]